MQVRLLAIGKKMPGWVTEATGLYLQRLPREYHFSITEIAQSPATVSATERVKSEGEALLGKIAEDERVIALDVEGKAWSTAELAQQLDSWKSQGEKVCLLVGGPDGLSPACLARSQARWSLSALTLPHPLVRVILTEQIYRAHTILINHPYHRA